MDSEIRTTKKYFTNNMDSVAVTEDILEGSIENEGKSFLDKCRGPPPTVDKILSSMDNLDMIIHLLSVVMAFVTIAIFIEELFYLKSHIRTNYRRRRLSIILASIPPVFTTASLVGTFFPRGNLIIEFVCSVYFGFGIHALLNLMVNYYGGVTSMIKRLEGDPITITTMPLCCVFRKCVPTFTMTRKFYKTFYYLTLQAALSRPIVLFFRGVFVLDTTYSINEFVFMVVLLVSMLTGMWALVVFRGCSNQPLAQYHVTGKFFAFQFVLLVSNLQPFIIKLVSLPCVPPYTTIGRILTVNYQIMVLEFFFLSLLTRALYRTKNDALELVDVENPNNKNSITNSKSDSVISSNSCLVEEKQTHSSSLV